MAILPPASATAVALSVLSGCCVIARLFSRLAFVKHVGIDDCLIALAWSASVALAVLIVQSQKNSSLPTGDSTNDGDSNRLLKDVWSASLAYNIGVLFLKDSLLLQYLRFSIDTGYRRACWALGTIVTAYGVSALFVGIFSCQPISFAWDDRITGGRCVNFLAFWLFNASFNSATDIIICVLPIPVLKALSLPRKQAIILFSLFLLGSFVCAASIVRLVAIYTATVSAENDPKINLWSTIEINVGIICACLPSLRHPITQLSPRIFANRRGASHGSAPRSHTSINVETKKSGSANHSMDYGRSSVSSETSYSHNSNVIDFSYFGLDKSNDESEHDLSTPSTKTMTPGTPTSLLFDVEAQTPFDTISPCDYDSSSSSDRNSNNKPLPLPPMPNMPTPAARPAGPRPQQSSTKVFTMRSHKVRYEPRTILPLACIPESLSAGSSPARGSSQLGRQQDGLNVASEHDERLNNSHERARRTSIKAKSPQSPLQSQARTIGAATSTPTIYGNIAPWDACPCPESKTYSYEILGGPRALESAEKRSLSRREKARRERDRNERARRAELEKRERQQRTRPNGPREMG